MVRRIGPRGPDDATISQINSSSILGFHRLALMDPSAAGNQPFRADGRALVCNGEIYNYKQLAQAHRVDLKTGSDCEVLLPLHRELGIDALCKRLDGVFAFAVVDQGRLYFARDPSAFDHSLLQKEPTCWSTKLWSVRRLKESCRHLTKSNHFRPEICTIRHGKASAHALLSLRLSRTVRDYRRRSHRRH